MIKIIQGDITTLAVDAIVNAANQVMLGGGGVDGAIHRAAGKELFDACLKVPEVRPGVRCPTGEARITPGFKLPAKFVIHTVGPVYCDGQHGEPEKLANCYRNSLTLAAENGCKSIAFPCISTGIYGYPQEDAAKIAVEEVKRSLSPVEGEEEMEVIFCCFSERDKSVYDGEMKGCGVMTIEITGKDIPESVNDWNEICRLFQGIEVGKRIEISNPREVLSFLRNLQGIMESSADQQLGVAASPLRQDGQFVDLRDMKALYEGVEMPKEESEMVKRLEVLSQEWVKYIQKSTNLCGNIELFNMDGFYPFYAKQKPRILFVGREACWMQGKNYITTVCPCIKDDNFNGWTVNQYPFHRRQFYIAYGIIRFFSEGEFPDWDNVPWASEMAKNIFGRINGELTGTLDSISWAFINLSKFSNETGAYQTDYTNRYWPFVNDEQNCAYLKEQINILRPQLIVGANVEELVEILGYCKCDNSVANCFYYAPENKLPPFLNCFHFAAFKSDRDGFYVPVGKTLTSHVDEFKQYLLKFP